MCSVLKEALKMKGVQYLAGLLLLLFVQNSIGVPLQDDNTRLEKWPFMVFHVLYSVFLSNDLLICHRFGQFMYYNTRISSRRAAQRQQKVFWRGVRDSQPRRDIQRELSPTTTANTWRPGEHKTLFSGS